MIAEVWDPTDMSFTKTGSLNIPRADHQAILLNDGRVFVMGGIGNRDSGELWDPATGEWMMSGKMEVGRYEFGASMLPDGRVIVAGGNSAAGVSGSGMTATAEVFTP
jgi:hypothetical protein